MWTLSRDNVITKPRQQIQSKKLMFTIIWNPSGFSVVDRLPNNTKINSAYFVTIGFIPLEGAMFPQGRAPRERELVIHLDNCSIHTRRVSRDWREEHGSVCISQQPIHLIRPFVTSTCLPQSKKNWNGLSWLTTTSFFESLQAILSGLDHKQFNAVFPG
jgi:hypothetical protein